MNKNRIREAIDKYPKRHVDSDNSITLTDVVDKFYVVSEKQFFPVSFLKRCGGIDKAILFALSD